jgi:hypothetical protein
VRQHRERPPPAGVYRIDHETGGRHLIDASTDAQAMLNRMRAQLDMGSHQNKYLQADWDNDGAQAFQFESLDLLPPTDGTDEDVSEDLETLLELWGNKLEVESGDLY